MHKVYCIIVTYNGEKWIRKCLSTIEEPNLDLTILVVDNNSTDKTVQIIKDEFPFVRLIEKKENLGFGGANNLGYEIAKKDNAEFIYLLNQDTVSYQDTIFKLIKVSQLIDNVGVVSPIHLNEKGDLLDSNFEGYINSKTCKNYISDHTLGNVKAYYEPGFINAAAWLIKMERITYLGGLFSKAFYHYGEDVNFIGRLRKFGFTNIIVPGIYIHHCREERKGAMSADFQNRIVEINRVNIMHDIRSDYSRCLSNIVKYALQQLSKVNVIASLKIITYPILKYQEIKKYRSSYLERSLEK
ncbi:Glycosyltransferase, GT2 family [Kaistella treverensis]|uniref:Glycosyltransferase, GT2 family n=1 Tax=Kaistella treverensis TaxID=631455 RepID=A0A1I3NJA1_9FLAO|nr:glycosyltransferase family 2 protein [Kaistella treverensis]SFJ09242.1 Glycosyltransferase, GT2 family [Kaistella treverensis]